MGLVAKAFQDIITFSRATAGTYVNSNGYITNSSVLNYLTYSNAPDNAAWTKSNSFVQTNLLTNSEDFNSWSKSSSAVTVNAVIAPDGTLTADKIVVNAAVSLGVATGAGVRQDTTKSASPVTYTRSFYAKSGEFNSVVSFMSNTAATSSAYATFNLSNGTFTGPTASGFTSASASITDAGNGWYRCVLTATTDSDTGMRNSMFPADTVATTGNGTSGIYLWGAQTVQGSVPGNYVATTSAALPVLYADYNGVVRARKLCEDTTTGTHSAQQTPAITSGATYTFSAHVKAAERTWAVVQLHSAIWAYVNLATGAVGTTSGSPTVVVTNAGNSWWRVSVSSAVVAANASNFIYPASGNGSVSYTGDGSSGIYIADAQLNDGSTATAYYDTTASAYNAPRFDYDPVTLAAKGLLIEEQRANLLLQSNDFQTSWNLTNVTRTLNQVLSPDGNVNGVKLAATAAVSTSLVQQAVVAATSATASIFVKQGTGATVGNQFVLRNNTSATNLIVGSLNYTTGVWAYTTGSTGVVVSNIGNGWWRLQVSVTAGVTAGDNIAWYPGWTGQTPAAGDFFYAYGAQLEAGAFATSYIPTTTSQFTRATDVASVNTLSPWFNQVAGTLYAEWDYIGDGSTSNPNTRTTVGISDGTSNNRFQIYNISGNTGGLIQTGGVTQAALDAGATTTANTIVKGALAYATNDAAYSRNGGAPSTDVSVTLPTVNVMYLGTEPVAQRLSGHLRRITYYPRRLTNAELQTLTTL